ncbi:putative ATP-dependent zinc protease [Halomicrobium katesii]|uniref:putative ATP-dependent zinc protease n=1 Tax=Halomicrobium katesii TaxID=437163 RepID=UPI001FE08ACC|nr:RimK/LysX family protein [Halomicrobium katesii]
MPRRVLELLIDQFSHRSSEVRAAFDQRVSAVAVPFGHRLCSAVSVPAPRRRRICRGRPSGWAEPGTAPTSLDARERRDRPQRATRPVRSKGTRYPAPRSRWAFADPYYNCFIRPRDPLTGRLPGRATIRRHRSHWNCTSRIRTNGRDGAEQAIAKSDIGAQRTSIDTDLAGRIGTGPLVGTTDVRSGTGSETETRPLVDVGLCLNGRWRTVTASITDRAEMTYPVLLGRDVLEAYTLEISKMVEE